MSAPITPAVTGEPAGTPGEPGATGAPATGEKPPATGQPTAPAAPTEQGATTDELAALDPATLAKMVRDLRTEKAAGRTNAKTKAANEARQQLAQDIGKVARWR